MNPFLRFFNLQPDLLQIKVCLKIMIEQFAKNEFGKNKHPGKTGSRI